MSKSQLETLLVSETSRAGHARPDGKGIFMLPASAVRAGATDAGDPIPITSASKAYIVASRANGLDVHTLILDVRTLKAVWTYTGQGMSGIKGFATVLACH
jgi:hypothetical protein